MHCVTGAFGYSGRHIARLLLDQGQPVCTLTGHSPADAGPIEVRPLALTEPATLRKALDGVEVLYNTYWVRFAHGDTTHEHATAGNLALFRAAAEAGVRRIVHTSITTPSVQSPLSYFRGKALVEAALKSSGISYAILRPAVFFGGRDVLINNIAFLLRRLPLFGVVSGRYRVQPTHIDDMARLAVAQGRAKDDVVLDAVGPEAFAFGDLVNRVNAAVHGRARVVDMPGWVVRAAAGITGWFVGDVVLTKDELAGLTADLLVQRELYEGAPAAGSAPIESPFATPCPTRLTDWLKDNAEPLGRTWASELGRHYRRDESQVP